MGALTAYCMKTKQKDTPFAGTPKIDKLGNKYMVKGEDKDGNGMCKIMGKDNALAAIKDGNAKKGKGW
jgi:hypothetical protein